MADFFKFPSTVHLAFLGTRQVREDKCMSPQERADFLSSEIVVEEKVDGANLGISFDQNGNVICQNRGHRLVEPFDGQWKPLKRWLDVRINDLFDFAGDRYILFGEWCYARHSVGYDALPDWFVLFDVYDKKVGRFFSTTRREAVAERLNLAQIQVVGRGRYTFQQLSMLEFQSHYGHENAEGVYLRRDESEWLEARSKLVRPAFRQTIEVHWSRRGLRTNVLSHDCHYCMLSERHI